MNICCSTFFEIVRPTHSARRCALFCTTMGFVLLVGIVTGCDRGSSAATKAGRDEAVPVHLAVAQEQDVPVRVEAIGWVEELNSVTIMPQIEGQIVEMPFTEGQQVKTGDRLIRIDPRPFEAALREADAALARDKALAADAEREAARIEDLFNRNIAADRERNQTRATADSRAAQVRADEATVEMAKLRLGYCDIRSPIDGVAGARLVDRGNIVKANEAALVVVKQINPIRVRFAVAERHVTRIREQMQRGVLSVEATIAGDDRPPEIGTLTFVDNKVDTTTGMIGLKATFSNEAGRLWPGRFVQVSLVVSTIPKAVVVPSEAIQVGQSGSNVFVVKPDGTVDLRRVTPGIQLRGRTVVSSGVSAGETVVTDGQLRLTPGVKVVDSAKSPTSRESQS